MAVTQKLTCVVERIVDHGERVYTRGAAARAAGAAVSRGAVPAPGARSVRSDRLLAGVARVLDRELAGANGTLVRITYAVHGRFTARMERELTEGRQVWIKMPYGDFVIESAAGRRAVRRRHGRHGVHRVPRGSADAERGQPVRLAYGARTEPTVDLRDVVERCADARAVAGRVLFRRAGRRRTIRRRRSPAGCRSTPSGRRCSRPLETQYYISGPPPMLRAIARTCGPATFRRRRFTLMPGNRLAARERSLQVGTRRIGPGEPCYVIAEVGINHNGDLAIAKQLVDAAVAAGADAVKFQKRKLRETYREEIIDQPRHGEQGLQYIVPLLIEFELSDDQFRELFAYCESSGITAMCTPWDRGERRLPRDLRSRGVQDRLARPHEFSAHRIRRRDRQADAALDGHVDRRGGPAHAGLPRAARRRVRALSLREHVPGGAGRDQPALHGTAARMVAPPGRLLGTRHRHRDFPGRRRDGRAHAGAPPDARPDDARPRPQGEPRAGAVRRTGARAPRGRGLASACRSAGSRAARR